MLGFELHTPYLLTFKNAFLSTRQTYQLPSTIFSSTSKPHHPRHTLKQTYQLPSTIDFHTNQINDETYHKAGISLTHLSNQIKVVAPLPTLRRKLLANQPPVAAPTPSQIPTMSLHQTDPSSQPSCNRPQLHHI